MARDVGRYAAINKCSQQHTSSSTCGVISARWDRTDLPNIYRTMRMQRRQRVAAARAAYGAAAAGLASAGLACAEQEAAQFVMYMHVASCIALSPPWLDDKCRLVQARPFREQIQRASLRRAPCLKRALCDTVVAPRSWRVPRGPARRQKQDTVRCFAAS